MERRALPPAFLETSLRFGEKDFFALSWASSSSLLLRRTTYQVFYWLVVDR
jgi:hypothetical protein